MCAGASKHGWLGFRFSQLRPLVCVLKQFWIDHGLDSVYDGGLGSFKLYMMCIHLLYHADVPQDIGDLLTVFFEFYSKFDYSTNIEVDGIVADFSSIDQLHRIKQIFADAARTLSMRQSIQTLLRADVLCKARDLSATRANRFLSSDSDEGPSKRRKM